MTIQRKVVPLWRLRGLEIDDETDIDRVPPIAKTIGVDLVAARAANRGCKFTVAITRHRPRSINRRARGGRAPSATRPLPPPARCNTLPPCATQRLVRSSQALDAASHSVTALVRFELRRDAPPYTGG
jgi:hypothetical protein